MKKLATVISALVLALLLVAYSGNNPAKAAETTPGGGRLLTTEDRKTGEGSEARDYYQADTMREAFSFDQSGTLTSYKKIYTFVDGAKKEEALKYITEADFTASIEGNTLVVDGNGNYLGFPYAQSNFEEIRKRLDDRGTQYTLQ